MADRQLQHLRFAQCIAQFTALMRGIIAAGSERCVWAGTQGEVILFAADAVETMGKDGIFVLLEGREQTVNYVRTPHRFTLVLSDESLIGKRRAAQRIMAEALSSIGDTATDEEVGNTLKAVLDKMTTE